MKPNSLLLLSVLSLALSACAREPSAAQLAAETEADPLAEAFDRLVNARDIRAEYWLELPASDCDSAGIATPCGYACAANPGSDPTCDVRPLSDMDLAGAQLAKGFVCIEERCVPAAARQRPNGVDVLQMYETPTNTLPNSDQVDTSMSSTAVYGAIPPHIYAWWTQTRGNCCSDGWATHRAWGVACSEDKLCCSGTCEVDPGCESDGSEDNVNGGSCGEPFQVLTAEVELDGRTCLFSGTIHPVIVNGICTWTLGEGVLTNCRNKLGDDGSDDPPIVEGTSS